MGDSRNNTLVALVLAAVATLAVAGLGLMQRAPPVLPASTPAPSVVVEPDFDVHVAGWVNRPGVVTVPEGSMVADAIAAAGGMRAGANAEAVNLAAPVDPGQQIVVPGPESPNAGAGSVANGLISLNRATATELETLPGVGPVLAERIVSHRESRGRFESVEDLLEVPGIGEAKLASLRDLVGP